MTLGFITQGSESFASWQANLLFEPIQFEVILVLSIFRYNFNLFCFSRVRLEFGVLNSVPY